MQEWITSDEIQKINFNLTLSPHLSVQLLNYYICSGGKSFRSREWIQSPDIEIDIFQERAGRREWTLEGRKVSGKDNSVQSDKTL